ncbi:MAG: histidine phosphatase family protein [Actinobacteria bacterium]|nr:histidine phosphatase family protein [Actinomycetota bacterium]MBU1492894.1 histidine phosphatase family protein [Actinomycetota bacterium]
MQITFIRHAETISNSSHVWQGHRDSPLSERGRLQAAALGRRPSLGSFDLVVASDLGRVQETAHLAGLEPEVDSAWREIHLGRWEGLTSAEIGARYPDDMAALRGGEDIPLGGGESSSALVERIEAAIAAIADRTDPGDRVAVLTHGGVIQSVVAGHLGLRGRPRPWPIDRLVNTSMTTLEYAGRPILRVFNDASHTEAARHPDETGSLVALVRHGETLANVEGRWQGVTDGALTEEGLAQAARLAAVYDGFGHVYASCLQRARDTAAALAAARGVGVAIRGDLHELDFGKWEDLTPEQVQEQSPEAWAAVYVHHRDLPRGAIGETAAAAGRRIAAAVQ